MSPKHGGVLDIQELINILGRSPWSSCGAPLVRHYECSWLWILALKEPGGEKPGRKQGERRAGSAGARSKEFSQCCKPKSHKENWEELREEESSLFLPNQRRNQSLKELQHISYKHLSSTYIKCPRVGNRWLPNPFPL